jgi:hypothetical protein
MHRLQHGYARARRAQADRAQMRQYRTVVLRTGGRRRVNFRHKRHEKKFWAAHDTPGFINAELRKTHIFDDFKNLTVVKDLRVSDAHSYRAVHKKTLLETV